MEVDVDNFLELAEQCEAAAGPDRELDARITHAVSWRWDGWEEGDLRVEDRDLIWFIDRVLNSTASIYRHAPSYTSSLDDSSKLEPEGSNTALAMQDRHSRRWRWELRLFDARRVSAWGSTAALARSAASLRALSLLEV